jgi:hypothetical protein
MGKIRKAVMFTLTVAFLSLLMAVPATAARPLHHASGDGYFSAPDKSGILNDFMFAYNARQLLADGTANGHMQHYNLTNGTILWFEIVHMEFVGGDNTVGLIGIVTKTINSNAEIGDCRAMVMQDNGEGKNAPADQRSKLSGKYGCGPVDFDDQSQFFLYELDGGNIQVR